MNRGTLTALILVIYVASPALAAEPRPGGTATKATAGAKGAEAEGAKTPPRKRIKIKEQTPGVSPQARALARQTKSVFIYAAESCERDAARCDKVLRTDAEQRFMDACGACNSTQRCEAERDAVNAGTARASKDPCTP